VTPTTDLTTPATPRRSARTLPGRWQRFSLAAMALVMMLGMTVAAAAQGEIVSTAIGEVPTTGGMRPGPVGAQPPASARRVGIEPTALRIEDAGIDALVQPLQIIEGVMQNPSGPFVVGWYEQTGKPGGDGNAVMAGHVDYWNVGPAVFYELPRGTVAEGDEIVVTGGDGNEYVYAVEWQKLYSLNELTPEIINGEIVGPTDGPSLTLITCGGEFDPITAQYLSRYVVRATLVT